jgi:VPDSG-CTERM motif
MKKIILAVLATAFVTAQAYAFSGSVFMSGQVATHQNAGNTNTVTFKNPGWTVLAAPAPTGAYTGSAGSAVTFTSFTYNNTTLAINGGGVTTFWSFAFGGHTYTFDLNSPLTSALSNSNQLLLGGSGTAFIDGADGSAAVWSLESTSGGGFKFTATSSTSTVPDGGSAVALLGIALAGIEGARRMIRARKA